MRLVTSLILVCVCVALLLIQFSGLHQHVGTQGVYSDTHGTHMHDFDAGGHDHDTNIDVAFFELSVTWSKIAPFLIALLAVLFFTSRTTRSVTFPHSQWLKPRKRSYWRPPLRAPPLHA